MNPKTINIIAIFSGILLFISLVLLALFGWQLATANQRKTNEIKSNLAKQEADLTTNFQNELEKTTITYTADDVFGGFQFDYPKVWYTNVKQEVGAAEELVFLADPALIVYNKDVKGPFTALRVKVFSEEYDQKVKDIQNKYIKNVKNPYKESDIKVSGLSGKKYEGTEALSGNSVTFVLLPLRDKTLYIGTDDSAKYLAKYTTILNSFKISK